MFREGSEARLAIPMYIRRFPAEVVMERKTATSERRVSTLNRSPVNIEIEPMTLHLDRVLEIEALVFDSLVKEGVCPKSPTTAWHYYVARKDGIIVGYVGMWVILEEAHITNIAVAPDYRRLGSARPCLRPCSVKQRKRDRMTLEVRVSNLGPGFYRKLGFADRGTRKGYYTDSNEDAIICGKMIWARRSRENAELGDGVSRAMLFRSSLPWRRSLWQRVWSQA